MSEGACNSRQSRFWYSRPIATIETDNSDSGIVDIRPADNSDSGMVRYHNSDTIESYSYDSSNNIINIRPAPIVALRPIADTSNSSRPFVQSQPKADNSDSM